MVHQVFFFLSLSLSVFTFLCRSFVSSCFLAPVLGKHVALAHMKRRCSCQIFLCSTFKKELANSAVLSKCKILWCCVSLNSFWTGTNILKDIEIVCAEHWCVFPQYLHANSFAFRVGDERLIVSEETGTHSLWDKNNNLIAAASLWLCIWYLEEVFLCQYISALTKERRCCSVSFSYLASHGEVENCAVMTKMLSIIMVWNEVVLFPRFSGHVFPWYVHPRNILHPSAESSELILHAWGKQPQQHCPVSVQ